MEFSEQNYSDLVDLTAVFIKNLIKMYSNNEIDLDSFVACSASKIAFLALSRGQKR